MIKVGIPQVRSAGRLMLGKTQKQALKQSVLNVQKLAMPSVIAMDIVLINKGKVLAKNSEGCDDVDYCSPLFP